MQLVGAMGQMKMIMPFISASHHLVPTTTSALTCISWRAGREPAESQATWPAGLKRGGSGSGSPRHSTCQESHVSERVPGTDTTGG